MSETRKTILLADDHPIYRQGLKQILESLGRFEIVAEAESGESALTQIRYLAPDLAIIDLAMPERDGLSVLEQCQAEHSDIQVIVLTSYDDPAYLERALELGARAYVLKDSAASDLVECLASIDSGKIYISPSIGRRSPEPPSLDAGIAQALDSLTPTERRVLSLLAQFKTSKEIARELDVSYRTIQNHRANIAGKLGLTGRHALMRFARKNLKDLARD